MNDIEKMDDIEKANISLNKIINSLEKMGLLDLYQEDINNIKAAINKPAEIIHDSDGDAHWSGHWFED